MLCASKKSRYGAPCVTAAQIGVSTPPFLSASPAASRPWIRRCSPRGSQIVFDPGSKVELLREKIFVLLEKYGRFCKSFEV